MTLEEFQIKITADTESASKKISGLKGIVSGIATATAAATAAVGAGVIAIGKSALESYASYEQLAGGVDKIFGSASETVKQFAEEAYKTAGIGANQYMEQVTSFSAALLNSLGGDSAKAAEAANQAIIDMADNANTFGTSMEAIQNAYQGFAKQNYTMLDNLKLGYGGTKTEMERLLSDAEKLSGIKYDISNLNDVYSAIHVIQTELNVTGTTAKEATSTIEGSINSMKASWSNLLTSLMRGTNITSATKSFVDSFTNVFNNIIALVPNFITGLLEAIQSGLPAILPGLIDAITTIIPGIIETATAVIPQILDAIINSLPQITDMIVSMTPTIVDAIIIIALGIVEALPDIIDVLIPMIPQIITTIITTIWNEIPTILSALTSVVVSIGQSLLGIVTNVLSSLWDSITNWIENSTSSIAEALRTGIDFVKNQLDIVINLFTGLWNGIKKIANGIVQMFKGDFKGGIQSALEGVKQIFSSIWNGIWGTLKNILNSMIRGVENMVNACVRGLNKLMSPLRNAGNKLLDFLGIDFSIPEFSSVSLPRLAKGGIVYGDTIARVGEYAGAASNPEVIAPLNKLSSLMGNNETNNLLRELINLVDTKEFKAYVSQKEIGQSAVKYINTQNRIMGGAVV